MLVQFAEVTDDRLARCAEIARGATERGLVLDADELAETPYALLGTAGEIAEEIINRAGVAPLRARLTELLINRLPDGQLVRALS